MKTGRLAALVFCLALCGAGAKGGEREDAPLSTLATGLQRLQDQVAMGDLAAFKAQPAALKSIGTAIEASGPDIWNETAERNAAVIYLLSGGSPGPVIRRLPGDVASKEESALLRAALAYARGRREEAKALFARFDPRKMDIRLAGLFAYARADLAAEEADQALEALDLARLLAPGGLVEEAALRREIGILEKRRDVDRFCFLSEQYVRRFPKSIYYDRFRQGLLAGLERMALGDGFAKIDRYLALLRALPADERRQALLGLARTATLSAHPEAAGAFARAALPETARQSADQARARLYDDAARVLTGDYAQAASDLEKLPGEQLDRKDGELLAAVRHLARAVVAEPPLPQDANEPTEESQTIRSAQEALQRSASLVAPEETEKKQ